MKTSRMIKLFAIGIAAFSMSCLSCDKAAAQAPTKQQNYTSQGFQASIVSVRTNRQTVIIQLVLKNISPSRQYVSYCMAAGGAVLTSGERLQFDTSRSSGIPHNSSSNMDVCLRTTALENMSYIEPNASTVIMLAWSDTNGHPVPLSEFISFPFTFVARTAQPSREIETQTREPGQIHTVNIPFPLVPLSSNR